MSRRRGEFEHRTSIFEGAFRAWSHLGGLEPEDLKNKPTSDLDPLTYPIESDSRLKGSKDTTENPDGSKRREYPYEPLPRSGLAHPYVQAILSPWLGPDADNDAIQLGLTTLRTWWQHRRKGESGSAIAALGTEKMKGVVEGYTRHFFTLAHCLVMNDKEQPPRTLHAKMKELEKMQNKRNKKRAREEEAGKIQLMAMSSGLPAETGTVAAGINADLTDTSLTPLERLHAAQRRQLAESGGVHSAIPQANDMSNVPVINIKNKCVPGKADLPAVVEAVSHQASRLAHRGSGAIATSSGSSVGSGAVPSTVTSGPSNSSQYGDPNTSPIVFITENGDILLAMLVEGITCAHCVKIVETVLKGCNGNKSPIEGLVDAAADRVLCSVLIKIDHVDNAKRIAFEAARNLAMVGYTAKAKEMSILIESNGQKVPADFPTLNRAFEIVAKNNRADIFDWSITCSCPDNGVLRDDCSRHSQMKPLIFEVFETRAQMVMQYVQSGNIDTSTEPEAFQPAQQQPQHQVDQQQQPPPQHQQLHDQAFQQSIIPAGNGMNGGNMGPNGGNMGQNGGMDFFGGNPGMGNGPGQGHPQPIPVGANGDGNEMMRHSQRNPSIISFGGNLRHMSITSETTFGRAMSGLSALSIDWENMDDFDINVDHSSHINNGVGNIGRMPPSDGMIEPQPLGGSGGGAGNRRSSLRRSFVAGDNDAHVSFKV